jgi:pilus assembly protein Flp/PilA
MIYAPGEEGQGLVEYALILVFIAIVVFVALGLMGTQLSTMYSQLTSMIPDP